MFRLSNLTRFQLRVKLLRFGCILRKEANTTTTDKFLLAEVMSDILRIILTCLQGRVR